VNHSSVNSLAGSLVLLRLVIRILHIINPDNIGSLSAFLPAMQLLARFFYHSVFGIEEIRTFQLGTFIHHYSPIALVVFWSFLSLLDVCNVKVDTICVFRRRWCFGMPWKLFLLCLRLCARFTHAQRTTGKFPSKCYCCFSYSFFINVSQHVMSFLHRHSFRCWNYCCNRCCALVERCSPWRSDFSISLMIHRIQDPFRCRDLDI
jgi:hypothetical protein